MTTLVAVAFALGLLLIYDGVTSERSRRRPAWIGALDRWALESAIRGLTGPRLLALTMATIVLSLVLVAGLTGSFVVAVAVSSIVGLWPITIARSRALKRARRLREEWPDAIAGLIAAIRAGISLPEACAGLATRAGDGLRPGFEAFIATYRSSGSFPAALERLRTTMTDPTGDRVVVALRLAHEVGGTDLVRVLRTLGDLVREDLRVRKEIEARWSWTVTAARVAVAAPWIVLLLMCLRPEAAAAYNSTTGVMVIAVGGLTTALGYMAMLRAARLPAERRLEL